MIPPKETVRLRKWGRPWRGTRESRFKVLAHEGAKEAVRNGCCAFVSRP